MIFQKNFLRTLTLIVLIPCGLLGMRKKSLPYSHFLGFPEEPPLETLRLIETWHLDLIENLPIPEGIDPKGLGDILKKSKNFLEKYHNKKTFYPRKKLNELMIGFLALNKASIFILTKSLESHKKYIKNNNSKLQSSCDTNESHLELYIGAYLERKDYMINLLLAQKDYTPPSEEEIEDLDIVKKEIKRLRKLKTTTPLFVLDKNKNKKIDIESICLNAIKLLEEKEKELPTIKK